MNRQIAFIIVLTVAAGLVFDVYITRTNAAGLISQSSQVDFQSGVIDSTLDVTSNSGSILLKAIGTDYTETEDEFNIGKQLSPGVGTIYAPTNGELRLNKVYSAFDYTTTSTPAVGGGARQANYDPDKCLLYAATAAGLNVINTQCTNSGVDDTSVFTYTTATTPAIGNNALYGTYIDRTNHLVYVATVGGGVSVINTQNTIDPLDDTLHFSYTTTSVPAIAHNNVYWVYLDEAQRLLYVGTYGGGLSVISTEGTLSPLDDILIKTYNTTSSPAILRNNVYVTYFDSVTKYLWVGTYRDTSDGGISVIDTKGTISAADDTLVKNYSPSTTPPFCYRVRGLAFDSALNQFYASCDTNGGVQVLNTFGTTETTDDTRNYAYYTTGSFAYNPTLPAKLLNDNNRGITFDPVRKWFTSFSSGGTSVIDTKGTANWQDDTMALIGDATSAPIFFAGTATGSSYIDQSNNIMYSPTGSGVTALNLNPTYGPNGTFISQPIDITTQAKTYLKWNQALNSGNSVNMQIRKGDANAAWIDDFNDGDLTNLTDYYTRNKAYNTKSELGGVASLTNPTSTYAQMALNTGKSANYFPAGSRISIRTRYVGSGANNVGFRLYSDNGEANTMNVGYLSSEWRTITLQPTSAFNIVELYNFWSGTWNSDTDRIDIDWIKIELPDAYWGSWGDACADNEGCSVGDTTGMNWVQYKANLSTIDNATTPLVNSVSLTDGYESTGIYTSAPLDGGSPQAWGTFTADVTTPSGTSIDYMTRSGSNSSPDESWSSWEAVSSGGDVLSPTNRYLQYRATLATTNSARTPVLNSVSISYSDQTAPVVALSSTPPSHTAATTYTFSGSIIEEGTGDTTLTINEESVTLSGSSSGSTSSSSSGSSPYTFSKEYALNVGSNTFNLVATDGSGNKTTSSYTITRNQFFAPSDPGNTVPFSLTTTTKNKKGVISTVTNTYNVTRTQILKSLTYAKSRFTKLDQAVVETFQKALKALGFYNKNIGSIFGPATRRGVRNYQKSVGLPVTGVADARTLAYMDGYRPTNLDEYIPAISQEKSGFTTKELQEARIYQLSKDIKKNKRDEEVKFVQKKLYILGYYSGTINGWLNYSTQQSISNYRKDHNLPKTKTLPIDQDLRSALNDMK